MCGTKLSGEREREKVNLTKMKANDEHTHKGACKEKQKGTTAKAKHNNQVDLQWIYGIL